MAVFQVETKENFNARNLMNIYFSAHPDDLAEYFETMKETVFQIQKCAVFYKKETIKEESKEWEEYLDHFKLMNVMVVFVTNRYLYTACQAYEFEFRFAREHHIPIIPVILEESAKTHFKDRMNELQQGFGNTQYIFKHTEQRERMTFKEKFSRALTEILIGDDLKERIQAAFDAYVFLSYRKKDRKDAERIIEQIHKIPYCRDFAIWYDEFLVPGEIWSDAISEELKRSNMVVLAATPAIEEEGNYVIAQEYPEAVKHGKKVLPVKTSETIRNQKMQELFPGIENLIDVTDQETLAKELIHVALKPSEKTPEHNYLIAQAYRMGLCVEKNAELALKALMDSGEQEYPESMKLLSCMFKYGDLVEYDLSKAAYWQSKCADYCRGQYEQDRTVSSEMKWDSEVKELGELYFEQEQYQKAEQLYLRQIEFLNREMKKIPINQQMLYQYQMSLYYENLGRITYAIGDDERAEQYYNQEFMICQQEFNGCITSMDRSICYERIGEVKERQGDYEIAAQLYGYSQQVRENEYEKEPTDNRAVNLLIGYAKLAGVIGKTEGPQKARLQYEKCIPLLEKLDYTEENLELKVNLYGFLYENAVQLQDIQLANYYATEAVRIVEESFTKNSSKRNNYLLANAYEHYADIKKMNMELDLSSAYFQKCLTLRKQYGTKYDQLDIAACYGNMADVNMQMKKLDQAEVYLHRSIGCISEDTIQQDWYKSLYIMIVNYQKLGNIQLQTQNATQAGVYYLEALKLAIQINKKYRDIKNRHTLLSIYLQLGLYKKDMKQYEEEIYYCEKAFDVWEQLLRTNREYANPTYMEFFINIYAHIQQLGNHYFSNSYLTLAKECYLKAIRILNQIYQLTQDNEIYTDIQKIKRDVWNIEEQGAGKLNVYDLMGEADMSFENILERLQRQEESLKNLYAILDEQNGEPAL